MTRVMLSPHFSLSEMTRSPNAARAGVENIPDAADVTNLTRLCIDVLEPLRTLIGRAVVVSSGYRSPAVNKLAGGSATSQHCKGEAADLEVPGIDNLALAYAIEKSSIPFDQLILEFHKVGDPASGWVHVSLKAKGNRRQVLTATTDGRATIYMPGLPTMQLPPR